MQPFNECPQFDTCSAPKCPLDPEYSERNKYPNDDKCKAQKPTRYRIGVKYPKVLPFKGLTPREYRGLERMYDKQSVPEILARKYRVK